MNILFKAIETSDKDTITSFTFKSPFQNCDFSFANICSWSFLYKSEYAVADGFLLIRFRIENGERFVYMCPVGDGDIALPIRLIEEDSLRHGHPLRLLGIGPIAKARLEECCPGDFRFIPERDYFDYIYLRDDLINLTGKKYQPKRNHINRFKTLYKYEYLPITPDLVQECLALECKWYKANHTDEVEEELSYERRSMTFTLRHASGLGLLGGAICVEGQIVAFSFGAPINDNTFGVHVEKADVSYDGAYNIINNEFALRIPEQYTFINREEDLGLSGLRQAKSSYRPVILLEKNTAIKETVSGQICE